MGRAATQNTHSTTGQVLDALTERISSPGGLTPTRQLFRREKWVPARDIRHSMVIGAAGIGGRSLGLVSFYTVSDSITFADTLMEGPLLLKNLQEALKMAGRCEDICKDFEKHRPPAMIHEWKMMKRRWEMDVSQPDPYQVIEKGKTIVHTTADVNSGTSQPQVSAP